MAYRNPCIVWSDLPSDTSPEELSEHVATQLSEMISAPIYTYRYGDHSDEMAGAAPEINDIAGSSLLERLVDKTPLRSLQVVLQYGFWKPPEEYDCVISQGPQPIHTVQRLHQDRIHYFDGAFSVFHHKSFGSSLSDRNPFLKLPKRLHRLHMRSAKQSAINLVDTVVVNSRWTADVVERLFDRSADEVIQPPIPVESYSPSYGTEIGEYFLYLGVVDDVHRVEEAIEAFDGTEHRLIVAGTGPKLQQLRCRAGNNIEFVGYTSGQEKRELLARCKALVVPTNHSFGRSMVECLASGRPVIAVERGNAPRLLTEGETGNLYEPGANNLRRCVESFDETAWDTATLAERAAEFSQTRIEDKWQRLLFDR